MQLSERLGAVAAFVTPGSIVADVGCDHAYTSIYMAENKIASHIIAMDINEGPVRIASDNVNAYNMQKYIEVRQSDGLKSLAASDNIDTVLISGMGGNLMIDILKSNNPVMSSVKELVLQPQSDICRVRHYLHDNGFKIIREKMVVDGGKYYTVIKAARGQQTFDREYEYIYGKYLIEECDEVFVNYLKKLYAANTGIIKSLDKPGGDIHICRIKELNRDNAIISAILENTTGMEETQYEND